MSPGTASARTSGGVLQKSDGGVSLLSGRWPSLLIEPQAAALIRCRTSSGITLFFVV